MHDCLRCHRHRLKLEEHLAEAGLIECKASRDSLELLMAFQVFAQDRRAVAPFVVEHKPGSDAAAWPFLFHPSTIGRCDGFSPVAEGAGRPDGDSRET